MSLKDLPLPQLRELAQETIKRMGEAKRQLAAVTRDGRGLSVTSILADLDTLYAWIVEQGLLSDKPPTLEDVALQDKVVKQTGRLAELVEKSAQQKGSLTVDERAEMKAVIAFIAEPAERALIRMRLADEFKELAAAMNPLIAQGERVGGAHSTIEALAKKMRS